MLKHKSILLPAILLLFFLMISTSSFASSTRWVAQNSGTTTDNLQDIFFTSSTTGYIVGGSGILLKTTDRGKTWTAISAGTSDGLMAVSYVNGTLYTLGAIFSNPNTIATLRKSTDNGANWTDVHSTTAVWNLYFDMWMADQNNFALVGSMSIFNNIDQTIDGGTSWAYSAPSLNAYRGVHATSASNIWAGGDGGDIARWNGTAWTAFNTGGGRIYGVHTVDSNHIWAACAQGSIYYTTNGESATPTWLNSLTGSASDMSNIWFVDTSKGWAIGGSGIIFYSSDGGATWTDQNTSVITTQNLNSIYFTDEFNGWIAGNNGVILKYVVDPTISSLSPLIGTLGTTVDAIVTGTNFQGTVGSTADRPDVSFSGDGITVSSVAYNSPTQITATIAIASTATTGSRRVTVTNPDTGTTYKDTAFTISSASDPVVPTTTQQDAAPGYPTGKQYWNPETNGALPISFTSDVASAKATLAMIQIGPPYSTFRRTISVALDNNKPLINSTSDFGEGYPNGIYKVFVFDDTSRKVLAKGLVTIYR